MKTHVVAAQQVRTGRGYVYSGQMTSVSAVLFPRACARACERDRVCARADDSAAVVGRPQPLVRRDQCWTKHTNGGLLFQTRFAADCCEKTKKARGWWRRLCVRLRGPDVFSVVFGIARWRSARCSASQAGRKEAAARVSRRGQSIQPSFSRLLLLFFWRNLCRLPAPLLVGFVVSSTHLLTDVQLLISQPSLPTYHRHFRLSSCLMLRPPGRWVSVSRCTATG